MLIFDIETRANKDALQYIEEPSAPANYKDPDKISAYIENKREEQIERAALDPDYGEIIAIGTMNLMNAKVETFLGGGDMEPLLLAEFWDMYQYHGGKSCGYNIIGFDFPYILRRSMALNVLPTIRPDLRKYQTYPTLDLMGVLYNWGQAKSLKWVCERYGIENPLPDLDGSKVAEMDSETLRAYVENDVQITYKLYTLMKGIYF
jgi:predicted PolB exonuclease-like 3'-5' exonuclease